MSYPIDATFRPLTGWPADLPRTRLPKSSPFKLPWGRVLEQLKRELRHLGARDVVIQIDLDERQIRLDGYPRADARPRSPGVILSFESRHGPQYYPCDTFRTWQDNIRAIAQTLENLRAIDRYGVSKRGEQYRGWGALPPAGGSATTMTAASAAAVFVSMGGGDAAGILRDRAYAAEVYRRAVRACHPDHHGEQFTAAFQDLQTARSVLNRHHGGGR